jgi:membrane-bound hydrogenase subunit beta
MADPVTPEEKPEAPTLVAENKVKDDLIAQFPFLADQVTVQRVRRVWANVPMDQLHPVLVYAKEQLDFSMLCTITGTDEGETLGLLYHLAQDAGIVLTLVTTAPKDGPGPSTITPYFPAAELSEREVIDLLGAKIQNMPEGPRYPLPDGWPEGQYPLRKDWKPDGATANPTGQAAQPAAQEKSG